MTDHLIVRFARAAVVPILVTAFMIDRLLTALESAEKREARLRYEKDYVHYDLR